MADADERLRLLTVTEVDTSPDLRQATVYLSIAAEEAAEALEERRARPPGGDRTPGAKMKRTPKLDASSRTRPIAHGARDRRGAPAPRHRPRADEPGVRAGGGGPHGPGGHRQGGRLDQPRRRGQAAGGLLGQRRGGPRRDPRPDGHRGPAGRASAGSRGCCASSRRLHQVLRGRARARAGHHEPGRRRRGHRRDGTWRASSSDQVPPAAGALTGEHAPGPSDGLGRPRSAACGSTSWPAPGHRGRARRPAGHRGALRRRRHRRSRSAGASW